MMKPKTRATAVKLVELVVATATSTKTSGITIQKTNASKQPDIPTTFPVLAKRSVLSAPLGVALLIV
jgi:hypothetical protein